MSQTKYMPLYIDAYTADTMHLTTEQHGAYLLLIMATWRNNGVPLADDDARLARIVGASPFKWRKMRPVLEEFFDISDGTWRQKKLESVYEQVMTRVKNSRDSGQKFSRAAAATS